IALVRYQLDPKPRIEIAAVVFSAAGEARDHAADAAHAREFLPTIRTTVNKSRRVNLRRERQIVTTRFVRDVESAAGFAPFDSMRRDSASPSPKLSEQMRECVTQGGIDGRAGLAANRSEVVITQQRIQRN